MVDPRQTRQLFDIGVLSLGVPLDDQEAAPDAKQALLAFTRASEAEPDMCDAWLGRIACGDRDGAVIFNLFRSRSNFHLEFRRNGLHPTAIDARFATGYYIDYPILSRTDVEAAYAASLIADQDYTAADEVLNGAQRTPITDYVRGLLHFVTQRWPDVMKTLSGSGEWTDEYMRAGADVMVGTACARTGLFGEAIRRLSQAEEGPIPAAATMARHVRGLCLRADDKEDEARAIFEEIYSRDPGFEANAKALQDPRLRLIITDPADVERRTDRWDPDSVPKEAADEQSSDQVALLTQAQAELDRQVGLGSVKTQVAKLKSAAQLAKVRADKGLATTARSQHLVFTGPPGTGKTTIARVVAKIYCGLGLIKSDKLVEASRRDFVGQHLGATAPKTSALIDSALDGVLFIDEAYTLIQDGLSGGDAFGREAVDTLLARMEADRDRLIVIIAGYDGEIDRFLATNEGLASRFARRIGFESYSPAELAQIAEVLADGRDSLLTPEAVALLHDACGPLFERTSNDPTAPRQRLIDLAGNGRFVRNVVEAAEEEREFRLSSGDVDIAELSTEDLTTITAEDMQAALSSVLSGLRLPV
ncbi:type VII secretion AAA-ATPase EccA [Gordonia crocea]|uniref:type VII secretion AAA-ATPase EccA n=1 Tax=Gordonia crocea TaxID=589162 RepID=UPI001643410A|nr:type VII secretion AAA-ATPase EccA [Gordonia crocea]